MTNNFLPLNVNDETSRLRAVVLGTATSNGPIPSFEEAYDPKSRKHILEGTYPNNQDMEHEIETLAKVFEKYDVQLFRPKTIECYNQIFARDIAFVIEDKFIKSNILPARDKEIIAIQGLIDQIAPQNIITLPEQVHVEGGDVMLYNDYIFVGVYTAADYPNIITARTNAESVTALQQLFPNKKIKTFQLRKSNTDAKNNALHLDCCFQPVGKNKAIIHKNGFLIEQEYQWLVDFFGKENIFEITKTEMYEMYSNIFSISPEVVISEKNFTRLNHWLRSQNITVEEIPYAEIGKQEGLLRCSTIPLIRD